MLARDAIVNILSMWIANFMQYASCLVPLEVVEIDSYRAIRIIFFEAKPRYSLNGQAKFYLSTFTQLHKDSLSTTQP